MSLPHMAWRYVGTAPFGTSGVTPTPSLPLDALWTLATSSTYFDGTARTQGSGSAGTWTRVQVSSVTECVYCVPPVGSLNQRIMVGGSTSTPGGIPMQPNDSYNTTSLLVNLVKNAGGTPPTGNGWAAASPFGAGQVYGWGKFWQTPNGAGYVYLWEGKEAIAVLITNNPQNSTYGFIAGAIIDPETSDTNVDSELDGRVYGVIRTGYSQPISANFWTDGYNPNNSQHRFLNFTGSYGDATTSYDNQSSAGVFLPNTASRGMMYTMLTHTWAPGATSMRTRSGLFARIPITYRIASSDNMLGRLRDIFMFSDAQIGQRLTSGTTPIGYVLSGSAVSNVDCILLEHG